MKTRRTLTILQIDVEDEVAGTSANEYFSFTTIQLGRLSFD
jgi:hypothetical protein